MAVEPGTTSACYDPKLTFTPAVGRLPVLGKIRAEIDLIRAQGENALNEIINRDLSQTLNNTKVTAELAALATQTADSTRKINQEIAESQANVTNSTNKVTQEIASMIQGTTNDTTRATNDTTRATNDTNRAIAENAALTSKTDAEVNLLAQKKETELAQVSDVVATGTVVGVIGKQKALFTAQTDGFARDAEQKLTKIMADTWSVRQTTDGADAGLANLAEADIAEVIDKAKEGIGIVVAP